MNSIFEKDNMLPYVNTSMYQQPQQLQVVAPAKTQKNGMAITALVLTILSVFASLLIVPTVVASGFSIAAIMVAAKRGTSKAMGITCLSIAATMFVLSSLFWVLVFSQVDENTLSDAKTPAGYNLVDGTGVAYKLSPDKIVPCDSSGECVVNVSLVQVDPQLCQNGGTAEQSLVDQAAKAKRAPVFGAEYFPKITAGEKYDFKATYTGTGNGSLKVLEEMVITCA